MFAETESEELLNLLTQVRLVADEEARTSEQQQQQQVNAAQKLSPPYVASTSTTTTAASAGRYTASSTAATVDASTSWTVLDGSRSTTNFQRDGGYAPNTHVNYAHTAAGDAPADGGRQGLYYTTAATGRTPATGVKVLEYDADAQHIRRGDGGGDVFEENMNTTFQQPKQLFFMDAHKRSVLHRQQQQQQQEEGKEDGSASAAAFYTPANAFPNAATEVAMNTIRTAALPRGGGGVAGGSYADRPSLSHTSSMRSADGRLSVSSPAGPARAVPDPSSMPPTMASISRDVASGVPRDDRMITPNSAAVMSTVLSNYALPLDDGRDGAERMEDEKEDASLDGLARIAAELERAAEADDERAAAVYGLQHRTERTMDGAAVWTPARSSVGTPPSLLDNSTRSVYTPSQLPTARSPQQQQQQQQPSRPMSYAEGSAGRVNRNSVAAAGAAGGGGGGRTGPTTPITTAAPPTSASMSSCSSAAPAGSARYTASTHSQPYTMPYQQQQQPSSPPGATSAEAAVTAFFRVNSTTAYGTGDRANRMARDAASHGNEAAWRLSVEAELNELQRGHTHVDPSSHTNNNNGNNNNNNSRGGGGGGVNPSVQRYGTPTTTVSPLSATATTPYHQLLSQMRYSPQQQQQQQAGMRPNTPPDNHAFFAAPAFTRAAAADGSGASMTMAGLTTPMSSSASSRYTANVTRVHPGTSTTTTAATTTTFTSAPAGQFSVHGPAGGQRWSQQQQQQMSPAPADGNTRHTPSAAAAAAGGGAGAVPTSALWDRMSPYEKAMATAAAAASPHAMGGPAVFRTPDTVAKPVTLSSIASHLHGGEFLHTPDEATAYQTGMSPQQQQQRYPSPPTFTTSAVGSNNNNASTSSATTPAGVPPRRPGSAARPSDMGLSSNAALPLFSPPQPQQPQQPQPQRESATPSQLFAWSTSAQSSSSFSQTAPPRSLRPPQPTQQQTPVVQRRGSPEDTMTFAAQQQPPQQQSGNNHNNNNNNSPPSCSLRPSPQMRAPDGSSPTLRRYVITTPNTRANNNTTTYSNNNNTLSAGRRSGGGSPHGQYGGGGNNGGGNSAASRESRPRVQLSQTSAQMTGAGVLRSPLNANAYGSPHHNHTNTNSGVGGGSGYGNANNSSSGNGGGNGGAALGGSASAVSPAAVRALIERLQAAAPAVLGTTVDAPAGPTPAASTTPTTTTTTSAEGFSMLGAAGCPDVASAAVIVAMSHDQHGCRMLQAVLDAECDGDDGVSAPPAATTHGSMEDRYDEFGGRVDNNNSINIHNNNYYGSGGGGDGAAAAAERRRQRRAEAFYHSTAVQVILRAIEPRLDAVMADGYGNFLLQKVFDMAPDAERQRLLRLPSLQHHLCEVACSPHGTFAVQRLVETVRNTEEERLVFVALERDLLRLLTNANGGHVLMKVMECIRRQYTALTNTGSDGGNMPTSASAAGAAVYGAGAAPARSPNGPATPLRSLLQERVDALFTVMQQNLLFVCQHKQGCCIVQKCLDFLNACAGLAPSASAQRVRDGSDNHGAENRSSYSSPSPYASGSALRHRQSATEESDRDNSGSPTTTVPAQPVDYFEHMSALLLPCAQELSVNPYGNYVVTRLVDVCYTRGSTGTIDAIATVMQRDLVHLCTNKFASNVVEHILRHCSERRIRSICQALMTLPASPSVNSSLASAGVHVNAAVAAMNPAIARLPLTTVVMDSYGNYVIQTLLTVAPEDELTSPEAVDGGMLPVLQQLLPLLSSRNFGRKLETKTELALLRVEQYKQQQQQRRRL